MSFLSAFQGTFWGTFSASSHGRLRAKPDGIGLCELLGNLEGTGKGSLLAKIALDPPRST